MDDATRQARLRALPSIDELLTRPSLSSLLSKHPRPLAVSALREAVAMARTRLLSGADAPFTDDDVAQALTRLTTPNLKPVLNATGVVLHTNLGRAPLAQRAVERIAQVARGYSNLELDLESGDRGSRYAPVVGALCELTGAEDALVVNNCAAAVLLALAALSPGREAVVSRGELVEIGGGFRIPDVMRQSGAVLREVGTTNRTRLADYEGAIGEATGLLVKIHRSNFAVVGFTEEAPVKELAQLARDRGLPLLVDLGSGVLGPFGGEGLSTEPTVASAVAAGADVVAFSGDKLLGGPQAGVLVGRREAIARLKQHPLNRALRIDKLTVAALEATLELYREGVEGDEVPARWLLSQPKGSLEARAKRLLGALEGRGVKGRVVASTAQVGGGCMPLATPPSFAVAVEAPGAQALAGRLRAQRPAVVARLNDEQLWLDVLCLLDDDLDAVAGSVASALAGDPC